MHSSLGLHYRDELPDDPKSQNKKVRYEELQEIASRLETVFSFSNFHLFNNLVTDLQVTILKLAWTSASHLSLIKVCKKFRSLICRQQFFNDIRNIAYFPSPSILKFYYGRLSEISVRTFLLTSTLFDSNFLIRIGKQAWAYLGKSLVFYGKPELTIIRLITLLNKVYQKNISSLCSFFDKYSHLITPLSLRWLMVAHDEDFWPARLNWNTYSPCPDELLSLAISSFLRKTKLVGLGGNVTAFKFLLLIWEKYFPIDPDTILPIYNIPMEKKDVELLIDLMIKGWYLTPDKIFSSLIQMRFSNLTDKCLDKLMSLLEEKDISVQACYRFLDLIEKKKKYTRRVENLLIQKYPDIMLKKPFCPDEFRLDRAIYLIQLLPLGNHVSEKYLFSVLDHPLWQNISNRGLNRFIRIAIKHEYWNWLDQIFRNISKFRCDNNLLKDSIGKYKFIDRYFEKIDRETIKIKSLFSENLDYFKNPAAIEYIKSMM